MKNKWIILGAAVWCIVVFSFNLYGDLRRTRCTQEEDAGIYINPENQDEYWSREWESENNFTGVCMGFIAASGIWGWKWLDVVLPLEDKKSQ